MTVITKYAFKILKIVGLIETVEEKIVRLLVEEKAIVRILRTLEGKYDNDTRTECSNIRYRRSILNDDFIWLN
jgi:hypothetical protein